MVCHLQTFIALIVISDSYRMLESHFPQFPNENALFHHIQSKVGKEERLGTLLQFTMDKARLQVYHCIYVFLVH